METGICLYKGKLFQIEDTPDGANFKSLDDDYYFSRVAVNYIFQGKKCLDLEIEDSFAKETQTLTF